MKKQTIIFDFDGVIVNSFNTAFEVSQMMRPTLTKDRYQAKFNGNYYNAEHQDKIENEINFFKEYGEKFRKLDIDTKTKETILELSKTHNLFIVSSTIKSIIEKYLSRHGLLDSFTEILGSDTETSKVKKFNMIFDKHKISPEETIFLTDTSGDVREAQEANINLIVGILGGFQNEESLKRSNPNAIVKNFSEFFELINNS
jgi:phosphoglycolate phosphatase